MKPGAWIAAALLGLAGWVAGGAMLADPPPATAQTPAVEIGHAQDARFVPRFRRDRPVFILAIGSDARPGENVARRLADSLHLIGINPSRRAASVLGFPRDSYVAIPGVGQRKINDALYYGGPDLVVQTVEDLVGVKVDYHLLTSFGGLRSMVNEIGGIEVDIPYPMNDPLSGTDFDAGPRDLDGEEALAFTRDRKSTPNGDFSRSENQGTLMLAAFEKFHRDVGQNPLQLVTWLAAGMSNVQTDLSASEVFDLGLAALSIEPGDVTNRVVPGGIAQVGGASVVTLGGEAEALFRDVAQDGLIG